MGTLHAGNVAKLPRVDLVAVYDDDSAALGRAKGRHGVEVFSSVRAFLACPMDAVIITSSSQWHASQVEAAASAGLDIFVEKPVALTLAETDRVLAAVERAGAVIQIGFQRRWDPKYRRIKDVIDAGDIGDPVLLVSRGRDPDASRPSNWGLAKNGGIFVNCASHDYDLAQYLLGRGVDRISATGGVLVHRRLTEVADLDVCNTSLFFGSDAIGTLEWSRFSPAGFDAAIEVVGTRGLIRCGPNSGRGPITLTRSASGPSVIDFFADAYALSIAGFVRALLERTTPSPSVAEARSTIHLAELARRSYECNGVAISVPSLPPLDVATT